METCLNGPPRPFAIAFFKAGLGAGKAGQGARVQRLSQGTTKSRMETFLPQHQFMSFAGSLHPAMFFIGCNSAKLTGFNESAGPRQAVVGQPFPCDDSAEFVAARASS